MVVVGRRYAPLSVRLVEQALKVPGGGWGPVEDVLKLLPGGHYDVPFGAPDDEAGTTHAAPTASSAQRVLPCCPLKITALAHKFCHVTLSSGYGSEIFFCQLVPEAHTCAAYA